MKAAEWRDLGFFRAAQFLRLNSNPKLRAITEDVNKTNLFQKIVLRQGTASRFGFTLRLKQADRYGPIKPLAVI